MPDSCKHFVMGRPKESVLSSVDDRCHMICNVPLCAINIKIYCMFLFIFVYLLYEYD